MINWTPTEAQGPSTNSISVSVSNGAFSVTNSFTIIVEESNLPPVLPFRPNQVIFLPITLAVMNTATDTDIPANPLTYTLMVAPTNAMIDTNGIITWTPTLAQVEQLSVHHHSDGYEPVGDQIEVLEQHELLSRHGSSRPLTGCRRRTPSPPAESVGCVPVPTNAIAATNLLLFATNLPVNVWFSTNLPPTITNPNDQISMRRPA